MTYTNSIRKAGPLAASAVALGLMLALTSTPSAMAGEVISSGNFVGQSDHITTGKVTIERDGDRVLVILGPKFSLDGAPDPKLGFGKDGKFDKTTIFTKLKSLNGRQVYELPKSIALSSYNTFTVWCEKFSVPLGSAKLN